MAKEKAPGKVNRSEFIRNALTSDPELNLKQVKLLWTKSGHAGEITKVLFYQVRRKMGLKRAEYMWVFDDERR